MYWYSLYQDCFGAGYNLNMTNDPTMDANGDTNISGSLYVYSPFAPPGQLAPGAVTAEPSYGEQSLFSGTFGGGLFDTSVQMKILTITNIAFDIHVLPGTIPDANGNFGSMEVGLKSIGYGADTGYYTNYVTIPGAATNGWVHLAETNAAQFQYAANSSGDTYAQGVEFYYNQYGSGNYPTNLVVFWIDNLVVNSSVAPPPPPPPPTMSIGPAVPGLNLFTGSGTTSYYRENIEASLNNYTWVNASGPVSYSFTITNYPVGANDAVQCQIFLVPNPGTESGPDWNEPNCIFMDLESTTNPGVQWNFRYKTNEAGANSWMYTAASPTNTGGTLASISTNSALGTWTVTFNNNTNVTMTIPGGASTNFTIPDDAAGDTVNLFGSGVALYFGVQAGNAGGCNDHIVASEFKVTGTSADFDDNFVTDAGLLNTAIWAVNATYTNCVKLVAPGNPYWIQWTEPAPAFVLESTPSLSDPIWTMTTNNPVFLAGTNFTQLVSTNDLPPGNTAFFSLVQPVFSQLQILLPGETAAPGTPTGKTGTPDIEFAGSFFYATVNAVDAKWNLISSVNDMVAISSTDTNTADLPPNAALSGGTGQFTIVFTYAGTYTLTASDVTDTAIKSDTSSSVQCQ